MRSTNYDRGSATRVVAAQRPPWYGLTQARTVTFPLYVGAIVVIVLVALIPRVWDLSQTDMWSDEVLTLQRVQGPVNGMLDSLFSAGNQAPLYYFLMRLLPGDSAMWLRTPSVLLGLLSVVLVIQMVSTLCDDQVLGLEVGLLMALNPLHVALSRTARYYTLLMVLALILTWCFVLLLRGKRSWLLWGLFGVSSMMSYLLHYSTVVLPIVQFAVLALTTLRDKKLPWTVIVPWCVVQAVAVVPTLLWMFVASNQYEPFGYPYVTQSVGVLDLPISYLNLMVGFEGEWLWEIMPGILIATFGLLVGMVYAAREWFSHREYLMWLLLTVVPVPLLAVLTWTMGIQYRDRYFLVAMPAVILLVLWGWRRYSWAVQMAAVVILLVTNGYMTWRTFYSGHYERTNWSGASAYLAEHFHPGDMVLFERDVWLDAFALTYHGDQAVLDNSHVLFDYPELVDYEPDADRIWVIYRARHEDLHAQGWLRDDKLFTPYWCPISDWLRERQDRIVNSVEYDGVTIFLLTRDRPGVSDLKRAEAIFIP